MKTITLQTLNNAKKTHSPFAAMTAYDALFAYHAENKGVDVLLVGDSLSMVVQGHNSTVHATLDALIYHTQCVARGAQTAFIMADLPFMTYADKNMALKNAGKLMQAGAHMVKLEGGAWLSDTVKACVQNGIPVCGHLGLLPQSVHVYGGYGIKGKTDQESQQLISDAKALEQAGIQMLVLECVPASLATHITQMCSIPVIGIGSGPDTDGQILVLQDILGISTKIPRFAHNFMQDAKNIPHAIELYTTSVKTRDFPSSAYYWDYPA